MYIPTCPNSPHHHHSARRLQMEKRRNTAVKKRIQRYTLMKQQIWDSNPGMGLQGLCLLNSLYPVYRNRRDTHVTQKTFTVTWVSSVISAPREFVGSIRNPEVSVFVLFCFVLFCFVFHGSHLGAVLMQHFLHCSVCRKVEGCAFLLAGKSTHT